MKQFAIGVRLQIINVLTDDEDILFCSTLCAFVRLYIGTLFIVEGSGGFYMKYYLLRNESYYYFVFILN